MKDFEIMYAILKTLKAYSDTGEWKPECLLPDTLQVSEHKRNMLLRAMQKKGWIENVVFHDWIAFEEPQLDLEQPIEITIDGLEYLKNNNEMAKAKDALIRFIQNGNKIATVLKLILLRE